MRLDFVIPSLPLRVLKRVLTHSLQGRGKVQEEIPPVASATTELSPQVALVEIEAVLLQELTFPENILTMMFVGFRNVSLLQSSLTRRWFLCFFCPALKDRAKFI